MATQCPKCNHENPDDTLFCGKCGTQFPAPEKIEVTETIETPKEELTTGSTFAGRYQIIEELGRGGMGKVYKVHDTKIKEKIALKLIKPEIAKDKKTIERFSNELKFARKIRHKNICQMFDLGEEQGTNFITMEFVPGQDLKGLITQSGQLAVRTTINIAKQICDGLIEAHKLDVVHRDLKPGNIMIDKEGDVRIMDFGIARSIEARGITGEGMMIGTPEYMSPEQAEAKEVDHRSDIYSLGILLYEMLTGNVPFQGNTPISIGMKHKSERPKDPRKLNDQIPEILSRIILKCLEKEKRSRFQNTRELFDALDKMGEPRTETVRISDWQTSIAVLPFKNMSADPDQEYFCEGLAEELINALTQIKDLRVVARTSAFSFKGKELDIREIGKKLNVETLLEGSVRKAGSRLRVTAQLINVEDGYHLWSERFDKELTDIFDIQDEISLAITDKLKLKLLGEEMGKMVKRYTENLDAYTLYLKGLYFRRKMTEDNIRKSMEYFNRAIEKDPDYALAYAGLAYAYLALSFYAQISPEETHAKAKQAVLKAMDLDDQLAECYEASALIKAFFEWQWEAAKEECRQAIELNPGYVWAHFHLTNYLVYQGRFDEAVEEMQKAHELDPLNVGFNRNLGHAYFRAGHFEKAQETLQRTIEMDPSFPVTRLYLGYMYMQKSMYEKALDVIQKDTNIPEAFLDTQVGIVYARMGKRKEALQILNKYTKRSNEEFKSPYGLALLSFALGKDDLGFQWLEKGYETRDVWMCSIKMDFLLESVREDPRFKALLKKMNLE